ncbi:MAG: hypothetical protein ACM3YM_11895, partial [Sphingomonadales bacterium]
LRRAAAVAEHWRSQPQALPKPMETSLPHLGLRGQGYGDSALISGRSKRVTFPRSKPFSKPGQFDQLPAASTEGTSVSPLPDAVSAL